MAIFFVKLNKHSEIDILWNIAYRVAVTKVSAIGSFYVDKPNSIIVIVKIANKHVHVISLERKDVYIVGAELVSLEVILLLIKL